MLRPEAHRRIGFGTEPNFYHPGRFVLSKARVLLRIDRNPRAKHTVLSDFHGANCSALDRCLSSRPAQGLDQKSDEIQFLEEIIDFTHILREDLEGRFPLPFLNDNRRDILRTWFLAPTNRAVASGEMLTQTGRMVAILLQEHKKWPADCKERWDTLVEASKMLDAPMDALLEKAGVTQAVRLYLSGEAELCASDLEKIENAVYLANVDNCGDGPQAL